MKSLFYQLGFRQPILRSIQKQLSAQENKRKQATLDEVLRAARVMLQDIEGVVHIEEGVRHSLSDANRRFWTLRLHLLLCNNLAVVVYQNGEYAILILTITRSLLSDCMDRIERLSSSHNFRVLGSRGK